MSKTTRTHIFVTGATGYIGGSAVSALLSHSKFDTFQITALIRSPEKVALFNSVGVTAIVGTNSDFDTLTSLASTADVVLACADADDLYAARAILLGLKKRHEETNTVPILIHTSGTGVLIDDAAGNYATDNIYSDLDIAMIESLPKTQPHREVDLEVIAADKEGYVRSYIILPSMIYGIANTSLVSLGVQNPYSKQIPRLIKASLDRKQATLYISVFDAAMKGPDDTGHGREGYYFGENGEYRVGEISEILAELLHDMKRGKSPVPTVFTIEELQEYFGGPWMGSNSRARAERARLIGWNPVHTIDSLWASLKPEIEVMVERQNA